MADDRSRQVLDHHANGRFANPSLPDHKGGAARFWLSKLAGEVTWAAYDPEAYQPPRGTPSIDHTIHDNPQVTWIGQATVLIQYRGITVLTDPLLGLRASPVSFAGPKRLSPPGLTLQELPPIDVVVFSHDHYDHLDIKSVRALSSAGLFVAPLGIDRWLIQQGIAPSKVVGLDWWDAETRQIRGQAVRLTATPAQHVAGRGLLDRNTRLWASWSIAIEDFNVFFAGDTGYNNAQFKQIGRELGPFSLALLPIGSYSPRAHMSAVHVTPDEALNIHEDVRAERSMAIHWGTFFLTAEHPSEPPRLLDEASAARGYAQDQFAVFGIGETRRVPIQPLAADCANAGALWCFAAPAPDH